MGDNQKYREGVLKTLDQVMDDARRAMAMALWEEKYAGRSFFSVTEFVDDLMMQGMAAGDTADSLKTLLFSEVLAANNRASEASRPLDEQTFDPFDATQMFNAPAVASQSVTEPVSGKAAKP
ncbi:MAG: hypothetical protein ACPG4N_09000, partial [Gammaproteobacteria bacterium]